MRVYSVLLISVYRTGNMADPTARNQNCGINIIMLIFEFRSCDDVLRKSQHGLDSRKHSPNQI